MGTTSSHPATSSLQAYLRSDANPTWIEQHVDGCEPCQDKLDRLVSHGDLCSADSDMETHQDLEHSNISERYQILDRIGVGGMGEVYRAWDCLLQRTIAIKVNRRRSFRVSRFEQEAKICARLQHPGIVPIHDFGKLDDGRSFIAMKLVRGDTLRERLKKENTKRQILLQEFRHICQTMAYVHKEGVIHRDLKPDNILVGPFGETQIMDWGIAIDSKQEQSSQATGSGSGLRAVVGTKPYMSPEQARGEALGYETDVYALGVILIELLTGRPLTKISAEENAHEFVQEAARECDADEHLIDIARSCLAENPSDRLANAGELEQELEEYFEFCADSIKAAELQRARAETRAEIERKRRSFVVVASTLMILLIAFSVMAAAIVALQEHQKVLQAESKLVTATAFVSDDAPASQATLERSRHLVRELQTLPAIMLQRKNHVVTETIASLAIRQRQIQQELREAHRIAAMLGRFRHARRALHQANVGSLAGAANQCIDQYDAAFLDSGIQKGMPIADASRLLSSERCSAAQRNELIYGMHEWTLLTHFARGKDEAVWHRQLCDKVDSAPVRKHVWKLVETNNLAELKRLATHQQICKDEVAVLLASTMLNLKNKRQPELQAFRKQLLTRARIRHPESFHITRELALHYLQSYPSKFTDAKAVDLLSSCLLLNPEFRDTFIEWIRILSYRGNHEFSRRVLANEARNDPSNATIKAHLAMQLRHLALDQAESRACQAYEIDPSNRAAKLALATICLDHGDLPEARELIRCFEESERNADYYEVVAYLRKAEAEPQLAAKALWEAMRWADAQGQKRAVVHYALRLREEYGNSSWANAARIEIRKYLRWRSRHDQKYHISPTGELRKPRTDQTSAERSTS